MLNDKENNFPYTLNNLNQNYDHEKELSDVKSIRNIQIANIPEKIAGLSSQLVTTRSRFFPDEDLKQKEHEGISLQESRQFHMKDYNLYFPALPVSPQVDYSIASFSSGAPLTGRNFTDSGPNCTGGSAEIARPILKMTNIPWEISSSDVQIFFSKYTIPLDRIHIPIDRTTGKTKNEAYIEMGSFHDLIDALASKHRQIIKSREIFLNRSSSDELFRAHFPKMRLDLNEYITAEEISSIATICRYFKVVFEILALGFQRFIFFIRFIFLGNVQKDLLST